MGRENPAAVGESSVFVSRAGNAARGRESPWQSQSRLGVKTAPLPCNTCSDLFTRSLGLQLFCKKEAERIGKISIKLRYFQVLWSHFKNLYHRSHGNENVTLLS